MSGYGYIKAIIWVQIKKHKMRMILIALIVSPVLAYKHLLDLVDNIINWNGESELYMTPQLHDLEKPYQPSKVKMWQREEKRKIKDLLYVLNEHTCIKTFTTKWVKNCFFPIEIKF